MSKQIYTKDGETFGSRVHGEGVVKWIDRDNVIYERKWWRVIRVHEPTGRVGVVRFEFVDGVVMRQRCLGLVASVSRLKHRPTNVINEDQSA